MRSFRSRLIGVVLAALLVASAGAVSAVDVPPTGPAFGNYDAVPLLDDDSAYGGPITPTDLDEVRLSTLVGSELGASARERLAQQGFVVVPSQLRLFHEAYEGHFESGTPVFITTDVAYHMWHLVFDKTLRELEQKRLLPALEDLVKGMRKNAAVQAGELSGTALEDDAERVHDLLAVTAALLGVHSGELSDRAKAEKSLIEAHAEWTESPILDTKIDYSLFTPRGHYTRNDELKRYFVAMSVLGQHAFQLPGSRDADGSVRDKTDGLRRALLASRTLVGHPRLEVLWHEIFEPTAFLVGVSDDYTPFELAMAVEATVPGGLAEPQRATDRASLLSIADAVTAARPVEVDPERPSVRIMGTRFVLDSWIFDQLISPNVGTRVDPRVLGSPLDLAAAFGSDFALAIQEEAGETSKYRYPEQMAAMRTAVSARPDEAWGLTVYDAWLAAVEPMWLPHGAAFPDFMQSDAWRAKSQQTGFASYAELKHDTILYTKQAFGDTGGGPIPLLVRNWVEPDPVPFERLSAMAVLSRDGLLDRGLLPKQQKQLLNDYIKLVDRFARIAADELAGKAIAERDDDWLDYIGSDLERLWANSGDEVVRWEPEVDEDAAIVADIMRGLDGVVDEVLEIGTGYIDRIYVIVPDDNGRFHVARGGVYSYYEFPWPTPERLNDEQWRQMLRDGEAPDRPAWQEVLFPEVLGDPAPAPTPKPSRQEIEQELGATIEGATWEPYRRSPAGARFDPFKAGARTGVIFDELETELHRTVDYAVLFSFPDTDKLDGYWWKRASAAGSDAPWREAPCGDGRPGQGPWLDGEYLCYVSDSGNALLRWSDRRTNIYGVMNAVAGQKNLKTLYRQWQSIVDGA